jgi:hypothetical protein
VKYRQHGYNDSDRKDEREHRRPARQNNLTQEEKIQRRSMRHAIDRDAREVLRCYACGRNFTDLGAIGFATGCPGCAAPLHCCRICTHFDSSAQRQCRAEITETVSDKIKANSCTKFEPRLVLDVTGRRTSGSSAGGNDPKSQFDSLFKR